MAPILKVGTEKRPFLRRGQNRKMGPKSILCQKKKLQNAKRLMFIWENGTFLFSQLFTLMAGTDIRIFAQKSFFSMGPRFFQKTIGGHGLGLRKGVGPVPKSFFVSDLGHFS